MSNTVSHRLSHAPGSKGPWRLAAVAPLPVH
jgi:hypothetical protein